MTNKAKTKLVRCPSCRGQKITMGLGFSEKKCEPCKGIGYQEDVLDPIGYLEEQEEKNNKQVMVQDLKSEPEPVSLVQQVQYESAEKFDVEPIEAFKKEEVRDDAVILPSKRMKSAKRDFVL